jgi:hypothetical protein
LQSAFLLAIHRGLVHAYTDTPRQSGVTTLEDESRLGLRPYAILVDPMDVLGWRDEFFRGQRTLTQLRIHEVEEVPDGDYGVQVMERVRVFNRQLPPEDAEGDGITTWELWSRPVEQRNATFSMIDSGEVALGRIPLRTFYTKEKGFMQGSPALQDLAYKNLEHWQSSSDQRNILHTARVPVLFGRWVDWGASVSFGSGTAFSSDNDNADAKYLEHSGEAIGAGAADLESIEDDMVTLGLQPLIERTGNTSATEHAIKSSESNASLKAWTRRGRDWAQEVASDMLEWASIEDGEAMVDLHDDFGVTLRDSQDMLALITAYSAEPPAISRETLHSEMRRRSVLSSDFDPAKESQRLRAEAQRRRRLRTPNAVPKPNLLPSEPQDRPLPEDAE